MNDEVTIVRVLATVIVSMFGLGSITFGAYIRLVEHHFHSLSIAMIAAGVVMLILAAVCPLD